MGVDILKHIKEIECEKKRAEAFQAIVEVEEEGRRNLQLQEGCLELLDHLQTRFNLPLAVITRNDKAGVDVFLRVLEREAKQKNLQTPQFHTILTREDGDHLCKPRGDGIVHICEQWQVPTHSVLMVGDHIHDLAAGSDAGAVSCLIITEDPPNHHFTSDADFVISKLLDLLSDIPPIARPPSFFSSF